MQSLNSSSIFKLDLGRNPQAGDAFLAGFLPHLHAPTLEHLNLSAMDLTPASHDIILEYLSSSSSHALRLFECNGNRLTRPFGEGLIHCLWTGNFWLKHIQLHGNFMNSLTLPEKGTVRAASAIPANPAASETYSTMRPWMVCERDMDYALHRNRLAGNFAADAAIRLLPYARILVLQLGAASQREATASRQPLSEPVLSSALPFELKALILNELAPALSLKQCHRITQYVSIWSSGRSDFCRNFRAEKKNSGNLGLPRSRKCGHYATGVSQDGSVRYIRPEKYGRGAPSREQR